MWEKLQSFCDLLSAGGWVHYGMAAVMFERWSYIPVLFTMWVPRAAIGRGLEDDDLTAGRCQGSAIEIEGAVELCMRREARVDARLPEKVEGEL